MVRGLWCVTLASLALFCASCARHERFVILSGSENETLEPLLRDFAHDHGIDLEMRYEGSIDIMAELQKDRIPADAVWPAASIWITLGDRQFRVHNARSVMINPVVLGIRLSKAKELGFTDREVTVRDILRAIREKKLSFMMTSASQSNSGASAYIGFLYALAGNPDVLSATDLAKPALGNEIRELLSGINRSAGSSGWLKDLFLKGDYDAMVNYEAMIIEANQELVKQGREPLYVVYPVDGLVLADSPIGFVNQGVPRREEFFRQLQDYLLQERVQREILMRGRRVGYLAVTATPDSAVFNPAWGIHIDRVLAPIKLPPADVMLDALTLYQTEFRKPSLTVYCLDFSGSMEGEGVRALKEAMELLLDREKARQFLLQGSRGDIVTVIPFNEAPLDVWTARVGDTAAVSRLRGEIASLSPNDGTDIYAPVIRGIQEIQRYHAGDYTTAVILMTDGKSNRGRSLDDVKSAWRAAGLDVPIHAIMFGEASQEQLGALADFSRGRVFDGRKDLVSVFRTVKAYN